MRKYFKSIALAFVLAAAAPVTADAQTRVNRDEYPYSIMTPEPGERRAKPARRQVRPPDARPAREAKQAPRRRVRGSSTLSTIPTYRSPLTPLGTAPRIGTAPSVANPASPSQPVPGISGTAGVPAATPPRPAGQGFQDRAVGCVSSGAAQGVGPGQIGSFTRSCVNQ